jgi:hypothetical protein
MGWNFAYDWIRDWIFRDSTRLAKFNAELAKKTDPNGKANHDPIANYSDFFEVPEKIILDVCKGSNLIGGNAYDDLRTYLRQRNSYAHASDSQPTINQANGLIDHFIDSIDRLDP